MAIVKCVSLSVIRTEIASVNWVCALTFYDLIHRDKFTTYSSNLPPFAVKLFFRWLGKAQDTHITSSSRELIDYICTQDIFNSVFHKCTFMNHAFITMAMQ